MNPAHPIDLRSDTVTQPDAAMRAAMSAAEVGDDVYGEDPTVNRLQQRVAALLGKDAALFVPTGTMANQIALRAQTRHGDVVLAPAQSHIGRAEAGAGAAFSGVQIEALGCDGRFGVDDLRVAFVPADVHLAPPTLLVIENTHNASGGTVVPQERVQAAVALAHSAGLRAHLDGARLWNASVASGRTLAELAAPFDSVSVCLSKGLGAPAGSLLCGDAALIARALRLRKMFGGGMRQVGVLAAAGLHALDHRLPRLGEDHARARRLAAGLSAVGFDVDPDPETNMVRWRVGDLGGFLGAARAEGVLLGPIAPGVVRAVTHCGIDDAAIERALERLAIVHAATSARSSREPQPAAATRA